MFQVGDVGQMERQVKTYEPLQMKIEDKGTSVTFLNMQNLKEW